MAKVKITVTGFKCERCDHEWIPKNKAQAPRVCPRCKSAYWNVPRRKPERGAKKPAPES